MKALVLTSSVVLAFAAAALIPDYSTAADQNAPQTPTTAASVPVKLQIRNVDFHFSEKIVVHISALDGKLAQTGTGIPVFDDKNSFALDVDSADITITMAALTSDMNEFVF